MNEFLLATEEPPLAKSKASFGLKFQLKQFDCANKIGKLKQLVFARLDGLGEANGYILPRLEEQMEQIRDLLS